MGDNGEESRAFRRRIWAAVGIILLSLVTSFVVTVAVWTLSRAETRQEFFQGWKEVGNE